MNVIVKRPGEAPCAEQIENTLEGLQALVGGYIEAVTLASDLAVICNEEGRLMDLPHNCEVAGIDFVGAIVFVGVRDDDFTDVPYDVDGIRVLFPSLFEEGEEK